MDHTFHFSGRHNTAGLALRNIAAPISRQRELAFIVFLAVFCGSVAGALLFAPGPRYQEKRLIPASPSAISSFSEQPTEHYANVSRVTETQADELGHGTVLAFNAAQEQFFQQQLNQSEAALLLARAKTSATLARAAALKDLASRDSELQVTQVTKRDDATLLAELKSTLLSLQLKHREMLAKYAPTYPPVQEVEAQIADAQSAILDARQSPIQEVTTAKTPRQDWIATELAKAQADRSEFEAEATADYRLAKHYEHSLRLLGRTLAVQDESYRSARKSEKGYVPIDSHDKTTLLRTLDSRPRSNFMAVTNPTARNAIRGSQWWPVSAFFTAAIAGLFAAYLTDFFCAPVRNPRWRERTQSSSGMSTFSFKSCCGSETAAQETERRVVTPLSRG